MVILAIVAAIGIPAFSDWRESQAVRNAAQSLLAQLKQARVLAVSENRSVSILFATGSYTFDADTSGACATCKQEVNSLSKYASNLTMTSNKNPITFSSRSTSVNATITVAAGKHSRRIVINIIGRAYLK